MVDGVQPPKAADNCDTAAHSTATWPSAHHRINGTPAVLFEDGTRKPGAIPAEMVERLLAAAKKHGHPARRSCRFQPPRLACRSQHPAARHRRRPRCAWALPACCPSSPVRCWSGWWTSRRTPT
jgi:hypothetical protein